MRAMLFLARALLESLARTGAANPPATRQCLKSRPIRAAYSSDWLPASLFPPVSMERQFFAARPPQRPPAATPARNEIELPQRWRNTPAIARCRVCAPVPGKVSNFRGRARAPRKNPALALPCCPGPPASPQYPSCRRVPEKLPVPVRRIPAPSPRRHDRARRLLASSATTPLPSGRPVLERSPDIPHTRISRAHGLPAWWLHSPGCSKRAPHPSNLQAPSILPDLLRITPARPQCPRGPASTPLGRSTRRPRPACRPV